MNEFEKRQMQSALNRAQRELRAFRADEPENEDSEYHEAWEDEVDSLNRKIGGYQSRLDEWQREQDERDRREEEENERAWLRQRAAWDFGVSGSRPLWKPDPDDDPDEDEDGFDSFDDEEDGETDGWTDPGSFSRGGMDFRPASAPSCPPRQTAPAPPPSPQNANASGQPKGKGCATAAIVFAALYTAVWLVLCFVPGSSPKNLGQIFGYCLFFWAVSLVLYFVYKKK